MRKKHAKTGWGNPTYMEIKNIDTGKLNFKSHLPLLHGHNFVSVESSHLQLTIEIPDGQSDELLRVRFQERLFVVQTQKAGVFCDYEK